jgi:hypothetical protein
MSSLPPSGSAWNPEPWPGAQSPRRPGDKVPAPLSDPLVPPDLRGWLDRVAGVLRRSLVPLVIIQLGVAGVGAALSYLYGAVLVDPARVATPGSPAGLLLFLGLLFALAVGVFAQGASFYLAVRDAAGGPEVTVAEALRFAARRASTLVGWGLAAAMLTFFGLMMLIVPGIYFGIVFGAALVGVVLAERAGPARCFQLVNRRLWPTVGRMLIAGLVGALYEVVASFVVSALSTPGSVEGVVVSALCSVPLGVAAVGVAVVTYAELRFHENGAVFTSTLAAELDRVD